MQIHIHIHALERKLFRSCCCCCIHILGASPGFDESNLPAGHLIKHKLKKGYFKSPHLRRRRMVKLFALPNINGRNLLFKPVVNLSNFSTYCKLCLCVLLLGSSIEGNLFTNFGYCYYYQFSSSPLELKTIPTHISWTGQRVIINYFLEGVTLLCFSLFSLIEIIMLSPIIRGRHRRVQFV